MNNYQFPTILRRFPGSCPWLLIPTQPTTASEPSAEEQPPPQYNCFSSWHKIRAGKRKTLPKWLSMENRKVSSPWSFQHFGGFTRPSCAAHYGTTRIHREVLPGHSAAGVRRNPPPWERNVQRRPLPGYVLLTAIPGCTYRGKETPEKVAKRRWKKKRKVLKKKSTPFEQSRAQTLPMFHPYSLHWSQNKSRRVVRMSPICSVSVHRDVCPGCHTWATDTELCAGSAKQPTSPVWRWGVLSAGVTIRCLSAVYNQECYEIISLGRCEVNVQCNLV